MDWFVAASYKGSQFLDLDWGWDCDWDWDLGADRRIEYLSSFRHAERLSRRALNL